jgi:hypothetical protein
MGDDSDEVPRPSQQTQSSNLNVWRDAFGNLLETLNRAYNQVPADECGRYIIELEALATVVSTFGNLLETLNRAYNEVQVDERGRYIIELNALATFVSTFDKPISAHIFELASKLSNLDIGRNDPIFQPANVKDRLADAARQWRARARYVLAVEALVLTGTMPRLALQKIARDCPKLPAFAGKKAANTLSGKKAANSLSERVLKNWRKEFQRRRGSSDPARQATRHRAIAHLEGDLIFEEGVAWIKNRLLAGEREAVLAIASNVDEAAELGGVFTPPISHQ